MLEAIASLGIIVCSASLVVWVVWDIVTHRSETITLSELIKELEEIRHHLREDLDGV